MTPHDLRAALRDLGNREDIAAHGLALSRLAVDLVLQDERAAPDIYAAAIAQALQCTGVPWAEMTPAQQCEAAPLVLVAMWECWSRRHGTLPGVGHPDDWLMSEFTP